MSRTIHINLLKEDERRSSMPVRTRVMVPIFSGLLLLASLIWWLLLVVKNHELAAGVRDLDSKLADLRQSSQAVEALIVREKVANEGLAQIESYAHGRLVFGDVLAQLVDAVPDSIQLTGLDIPPPYLPPVVKVKEVATKGAKKAGKALATDNKVAAKIIEEQVFIKLNGLADSADSTDVLRLALSSGVFTNLVVKAEIPEGAFRISGENTGTFLFGITCACKGRRFE